MYTHTVLFVKMQLRPVCVRRQTFGHASASFNAKSKTCPGQHAGKSDWHDVVYSKQEQGLAGWLAITQECTLLSSSFFVSLTGSIHL